MTGRSIMTVAKILARQNGEDDRHWRAFVRKATEILDAIDPAEPAVATIPHEGLVNERDRKIGAGR